MLVRAESSRRRGRRRGSRFAKAEVRKAAAPRWAREEANRSGGNTSACTPKGAAGVKTDSIHGPRLPRLLHVAHERTGSWPVSPDRLRGIDLSLEYVGLGGVAWLIATARGDLREAPRLNCGADGDRDATARDSFAALASPITGFDERLAGGHDEPPRSTAPALVSLCGLESCAPSALDRLSVTPGGMIFDPTLGPQCVDPLCDLLGVGREEVLDYARGRGCPTRKPGESTGQSSFTTR